MATMQSERRLIRIQEVMEKTGLCRSAIYRAMEAGTFPRSRKVASMSVRWVSTEVDAWIDALPQSKE